MIRRSLFYGLTLILLGAVIYLMVRSEKAAEQPELPKFTEVTQEAKPSLTRVLNPADLQMAEPGREATIPPGCSLSFRNSGSVPYCNLQLRIVYLDRAGKSLETRDVIIKGTVAAGESFDSGGIFAAKAPAGTARCEAALLAADIGTQEAAGSPEEEEQTDSEPKPEDGGATSKPQNN